jgi:hypothetical protein
MSETGHNWRSKSDDELMEAAENFNDYTLEGKRSIYAELKRRKLESSVSIREEIIDGSLKSNVSTALKRYQDAYRFADSIVLVGNAIKVAGVLLAVILFLFLLVQSGAKGSLLMGAFIISILVAAVFFILGVVVSAQGQILRAGVDTAVHSSPFLTDEEKATTMGIRFQRHTT